MLEFYASAFTGKADRNGDIMDPKAFDEWLPEFYAAKQSLPISFNHAAILDGNDPTNVVGYAPADADHVWVDDYGLRVKAYLDVRSEKGKAVEYQVEKGLLTGASLAFGFMKEDTQKTDAGVLIKSVTRVLEAGLVPNPAEQAAVLLWMKSEGMTEQRRRGRAVHERRGVPSGDPEARPRSPRRAAPPRRTRSRRREVRHPRAARRDRGDSHQVRRGLGQGSTRRRVCGSCGRWRSSAVNKPVRWATTASPQGERRKGHLRTTTRKEYRDGAVRGVEEGTRGDRVLRQADRGEVARTPTCQPQSAPTSISEQEAVLVKAEGIQREAEKQQKDDERELRIKNIGREMDVNEQNEEIVTPSYGDPIEAFLKSD